MATREEVYELQQMRRDALEKLEYVNKELLGAHPIGEPHECRCEHCEPETFSILTGPRLGEHHKAVRFGHQFHWRVYLDGVEIPHAFESIEGDDGMIFVFARNDEGREHLCGKCQMVSSTNQHSHSHHYGPCMGILRGKVEMRMIADDPKPLPAFPTNN